jgi:hypothetical protein
MITMRVTPDAGVLSRRGEVYLHESADAAPAMRTSDTATTAVRMGSSWRSAFRVVRGAGIDVSGRRMEARVSSPARLEIVALTRPGARVRDTRASIAPEHYTSWVDLEAFLKPLYQDVDGVSRWPENERIARIARVIHPLADREFELLLLFRGLGKWLDRVGNASRVVLSVGGVTEAELRTVSQSIKRLHDPVTAAERAVAAAVLIDESGVRGLTSRFAGARREGLSLTDVVREAVADSWIPEWVPESAREWLQRRIDARRQFCATLIDELELADQVRISPARV